MAYKLEEFPWSDNYNSDLREVLALLKKVMADYDALYTRLTTAETDIVGLRKDMATLKRDVDAFMKAAQKQIDNAIADMNEEVAKKFVQLMNDVNNMFTAFRIEFNVLLDKQAKDFDRKLAEIDTNWRREARRIWEYILDVAPTEMKNPLSLVVEPIPDVIKYLYENASREHAMYNFEYESLGWDNDEYETRDIQNIKYALLGRDYAHRFYQFRALHPVYGIKTRPSNVYSYLATLLLDTMTDEKYTAEDMTNDEYAELDITNAEYLTMKPSDLSLGLTNTDYEMLYIGSADIARRGV